MKHFSKQRVQTFLDIHKNCKNQGKNCKKYRKIWHYSRVIKQDERKYKSLVKHYCTEISGTTLQLRYNKHMLKTTQVFVICKAQSAASCQSKYPELKKPLLQEKIKDEKKTDRKAERKKSCIALN